MHRLCFSLLVLIAVFGNLPAQTEPPGWITLAPEGAGFSVLVPGKAVETINQKSSFTLHSFNVTVGRATYIASYSDYVPGKLDPATALTANRDKFNQSLQGKLISSREITIDGHTGIDFTIETPAANVRSQLFLIGDRMFQTVAFVFRDADESKNVDRFFESFHFTKPAEIIRQDLQDFSGLTGFFLSILRNPVNPVYIYLPNHALKRTGRARV